MKTISKKFEQFYDFMSNVICGGQTGLFRR